MTSSSSLRRALLAVALVSAVAAGAGAGGRASYGARVTGDEPHYLLTAISLAEDRDLNVADEIAARRYEPFSEGGLDPQSRPLEGGRLVSPHDPGLPLLLAPGVAAGGWLGAKLTLALLAGALAAATLWLCVRRFGVPVTPAAVAVGIFGASAPLAVYGTQVYPELPAALATVGAVAAGTATRGRGRVVLACASVTALPWLSVKYAPVAAALAAVVLWTWWRAGDRRDAAWAAGILALSGAMFVAAHWAWYGGWTPYGVGDHFVTGEFGVVGFDPDFAGRSRRLIGLVVDREFGLAAWQPAWLLAIPALGALAIRRRTGWLFLAVPLAAGWLNATFVALTMHGWWWPGRQVVVVLPLVVVAIAAWAAESRRHVTSLAALGVLGIATYAWLTVEALSRRLTIVVDFYETANPLYRAWSLLLPDYRVVTGMTWALHALWIAAAAAGTWWGARSTRPSRAPASP
ncbi:MAG TPA: hypothetical protein VG318_16525 [Actinomycetota bacterium]|nr:hypothetical protein [Actinomycetota bacterium]